MLPIVTVGNETLRKIAPKVGSFDDRALQKLIDDMIPTMYAARGIGLAAPQVDVSLRLATLVPDPEQFDHFNKKKNDALIIINPLITDHSSSSEKKEEGCLSVPGVTGVVRRWKSVTVAYSDREGKRHTINAHGLFAKVFQHEIDHLNGILCIDRAEEIFTEPHDERLKKRAEVIEKKNSA